MVLHAKLVDHACCAGTELLPRMGRLQPVIRVTETLTLQACCPAENCRYRFLHGACFTFQSDHDLESKLFLVHGESSRMAGLLEHVLTACERVAYSSLLLCGGAVDQVAALAKIG